MLHETRALLIGLAALVAAGVTSVACGGGTTLDDTSQRPVNVVSPTSGLKVSATISSVSLGDHSGTNLQIAFFASEATAPATVAITKIVLVDATDGSIVDTLTASQPQVWTGGGYEAWNERVTPGGDLKASYQLTTPEWSKIDASGNGGSSLRGSRSYSTPFKLRVTMQIDGVEITLESSDLHREPVAVT